MSVRDGMLAILTLGPAYGSQLHAELTSRTPHRSPVNVGQIYTTIDRLSKQSLIESAGVTDDGLPLHRLTAAGRLHADEWMTVANPRITLDLTEMVDQVLITAGIDHAAARSIIASYRAHHGALRATTENATATASHSAELPGDPISRLSRLAIRTLSDAALDWLATVEEALQSEALPHPLAEGRRRRGRPTSHPEEAAISPEASLT